MRQVGNNFACRSHFLSLATTADGVRDHCPAASEFGGGVCASDVGKRHAQFCSDTFCATTLASAPKLHTHQHAPWCHTGQHAPMVSHWPARSYYHTGQHAHITSDTFCATTLTSVRRT